MATESHKNAEPTMFAIRESEANAAQTERDGATRHGWHETFKTLETWFQK